MIIKDHWYRPKGDEREGPCDFNGCGKPQAEHMESAGEWMTGKKHLAVPHPLSPTFCLRCDRKIGHSWHPLIPKGLRK